MSSPGSGPIRRSRARATRPRAPTSGFEVSARSRGSSAESVRIRRFSRLTTRPSGGISRASMSWGSTRSCWTRPAGSLRSTSTGRGGATMWRLSSRHASAGGVRPPWSAPGLAMGRMPGSSSRHPWPPASRGTLAPSCSLRPWPGGTSSACIPTTASSPTRIPCLAVGSGT